MTQMHNSEDRTADERAPYVAPRLHVVGTLHDLTQGPLGGGEDGFSGNLDSDPLG